MERDLEAITNAITTAGWLMGMCICRKTSLNTYSFEQVGSPSIKAILFTKKKWT